MPKVSEEYFENKKKMIVEAAYRVCLRKPVEMVTMMDVIEETGLSQGGIYRFYKDLDEILSDMVTGMRKDYSLIESLDRLYDDGQEHSFEEVVHGVCDILGKAMEENLMGIQKINFDLTVLAINEPKRIEKIMGTIGGRGNLEYLGRETLPALTEFAKKKGYVLKGDPNDLFRFIMAAYTGIEMNCILASCYGDGVAHVSCRPIPLFNTLADSVLSFFVPCKEET